MGKEINALRLHIGCGEKYLEGYVNIDFPQSEQTILRSHADVYADIRKLSYADNSVGEIRSHHLFIKKGGHKLPNIVAMAYKNAATIDEKAVD